MPRYTFTVHDGHISADDKEDVDLPSVEAVRVEAIRGARQMLSESDRNGVCRRHWSIRVADDAGVEILVFPFGHALVADYLPGATKVDLPRGA